MVSSLFQIFRKVTDALDEAGESLSCAADKFNQSAYSNFGIAPLFSWDRPAEIFEKRYGVSGISQNYIFPDGKTARDAVLELKCSSYGDDFNWREETVDKIIALNPELSDLVFDRSNSESLDSIIQGTTSAFNPEDIAHFIGWLEGSADGINRDDSQDDVYKLVIDRAEDIMLGVEIEWKPSPETMDRIKEQLGFSLDQRPSEQDLREAYKQLVSEHPQTVSRFPFSDLFSSSSEKFDFQAV